MITHYHIRGSEFLPRLAVVLFLFCHLQVLAVNKTSTGSGIWGTPGNWNPSGVPESGDNVTILSGHFIEITTNCPVANLTVSAGGSLTFQSGNALTISGNLIVDGNMFMNNSDLVFAKSGSLFTIGATGSFTWDPQTNTEAGASLFRNGIENLDPTSTLIIKKWYNYNIALGSLITGNFGNLTLNSISSGFLTEWNQNNEFQNHQVLGTLTVDEGWIVLDKSGSITNTTIGTISLLNTNSYLDLHGGNHPGSFTVNTSSVNVAGGMLNGIYDGNGNITLNVSNDVSISNSGSIFLIYNDGVAGVGNGNCTMTVNGNFIQSSGNFRSIFNLTTYSAGTSSLTFADLTITGGIFMGHYGCHTGGGLNTFHVTGNVSIQFSNSTDIFRIVGLSQLSGHVNNVHINCIIGGSFSTSGIGNAEVSFCVSSGNEYVSIGGNTSFGGCTNSFDYGVAAAAHSFSINFGANVNISGGTVYLARIGGNGTCTIAGNTDLSGGTLIAKGDVGNQTLRIQGNFTQSNGSFYFHYNPGTNTTNCINTIIEGSFTHSGGILNFDNNTSAQAATHTLTLNGKNYSLSGSGTITHAAAGTGSVFGQIIFNRPGTITFSRISDEHSIQQVKQRINTGCTLDISTGNVQIASNTMAGTSYLSVAPGGILQMNTNQVISNGTYPNSGMCIESGGFMKIKRTAGLYDGTANGTISALHNMNYYLGSTSTIEYNGEDNQVLTGTGSGLATTVNHQYGNLKINFQGTPDHEFVYPVSSNVIVRNVLDLEAGELNLNNHTLTVESGGTKAIIRNTGYVKSESNTAFNNSILKWKNLSAGSHIFPFGVTRASYIPVTFSPLSGMGGYAAISTRSTNTATNEPWATLNNANGNLIPKDSLHFFTEKVIDRWYNLDAPGFTADVTLSYRGSENTTLPDNQSGFFSIQVWNGTSWSSTTGISTGVTSGTGSIQVTHASNFSSWVAVSEKADKPIELISFEAKQIGKEVAISWLTGYENNNDFFNIERSSDGTNYTSIQEIDGAGSSKNQINYSARDLQPLPYTSYYRLKQTNYKGESTYSKPAVVIFSSDADATNEKPEILNVFPNPFKSEFSVDYSIAADDLVTIQLINTQGQIVFSKQLQTLKGTNRFDFTEGNKINPGNYILIITSNGLKVSKKIIKNV